MNVLPRRLIIVVDDLVVHEGGTRRLTSVQSSYPPADRVKDKPDLLFGQFLSKF